MFILSSELVQKAECSVPLDWLICRGSCSGSLFDVFPPLFFSLCMKSVFVLYDVWMRILYPLVGLIVEWLNFTGVNLNLLLHQQPLSLSLNMWFMCVLHPNCRTGDRCARCFSTSYSSSDCSTTTLHRLAAPVSFPFSFIPWPVWCLLLQINTHSCFLTASFKPWCSSPIHLQTINCLNLSPGCLASVSASGFLVDLGANVSARFVILM